ncbi:MAG: peptidase M61 domain protein [Bacteroidetes bacterium]|nr:MAG: peptidase M61 domain protein [Bacteroidota bacterium]
MEPEETVQVIHKRFILFVFVFGLLIPGTTAFAHKDELPAYRFTIDLTKVKDDKLPVELIVPGVSQDEITYYMPAIVPGTYEIYNFGRFVSEFKAFDAEGKILPVTATDTNSWKISEARRLQKITYRVEDTWDSKIKGEIVFEPGGTNIQADTNFVINTYGFCGYFEDMKLRRYELSFIRPQGFYGSTSLKGWSKDNRDTYISSSYMDLADSPVMYCKPDTTHIAVGGCDVLVSVYSPHQLITSKFVANTIRDLLGQQKEYLGGQLPVDRYAFLIYLSPDGFASASMGALEHSYSSMYCLPEMTEYYIGPKLRDFAAHEFFHIVTPLNIHSEEIGEFDYNKPKMSQHLWLYEGLTEYAAGLVQVKYGKMTLDEYIHVISDKMQDALKYRDDLSFTEMSKGVLDKYKDQYGNVYEKGMLIGMCLDLKLRKLSDGKYGVQELMRDLSKTYGKHKSFKDDELIPQITKLTYPEIGEFFRKHVQGAERLPFAELLGDAGIHYKARQEDKKLTPFGGLNLVIDQDNGEVILVDLGGSTGFAKEMGYKEGDIVRTLNGKTLKGNEALKVIAEIVNDAREGDKIKVTVDRKNDSGKYEPMTLKGKLRFVETVLENVITVAEKPTARQLELRKAWINK